MSKTIFLVLFLLFFLIMLKRLYWRKNEILSIEFFEDAEFKKPFVFDNKENLYFELKDGDVSPILALQDICMSICFTPFLPSCYKTHWFNNIEFRVRTLDDVKIDLSKYMPKDNLVVFLNDDDARFFDNIGFYRANIDILEKDKGFPFKVQSPVYIIVKEGTKVSLDKVNEVAKKLKEEYGIKEVNVFIQDCFISYYSTFEVTYHSKSIFALNDIKYGLQDADGFFLTLIDKRSESKDIEFVYEFINKFITTNSTSILEVQDTHRLKVIDCYDIFNDYYNAK